MSIVVASMSRVAIASGQIPESPFRRCEIQDRPNQIGGPRQKGVRVVNPTSRRFDAICGFSFFFRIVPWETTIFRIVPVIFRIVPRFRTFLSCEHRKVIWDRSEMKIRLRLGKFRVVPLGTFFQDRPVPWGRS